MISKNLIEQIIWLYKDTLDVNTVVDRFAPIIENQNISSPKVRLIPKLINNHTFSDTDDLRKKELVLKIIDIVAEVTQVSEKLIVSNKRSNDITKARNLVMFLSFKVYQCGAKRIGLLLGNRDRTTVMSGANTASNLIDTDDDYNTLFWNIQSKCDIAIGNNE
jgi:chromosomal replication initiation ATPase DnaA